MSSLRNTATPAQPRLHTPGVKGNGQFTYRQQSADQVTLDSAEQGWWPQTHPDAGQVARARAEAERRAALYGEPAEGLEGLTARLARDIAEQESGYRAFLAGEPHIDDQAYEEIWEGTRKGLSRTFVEQGLHWAKTEPNIADRDAIIALYTEALRPGVCGRNMSINQAIVWQNRNASMPAPPF